MPNQPSLAQRPEVSRKQIAVTMLLGAPFLVTLALVSGAQYIDDPFGHFDHATRHGMQLRALVLDTWTRPVPNLAFWAAGGLGIDLAFVVPVVLTLAALGLCASLSARVLAGAHGTAGGLALLALP